MKHLFFLLLCCCTAILTAQTNSFAGEYLLTYEPVDTTVLAYNLYLKPDGTFVFHFYRNIDASQPKENNYGKGTWTVAKDKLIYFHADKANDFDEIHTLNFTNTKARIIKKSPRNLSKKDIKEAILFYDSEIFWVEGLKLFKKV